MAAAALRASLRFRQILVQQPVKSWKKCSKWTQVCSISTSSHTAKEKEIDPGLRLGDYPVLPRISHQVLPPTGWEDNQERRNRETPVHEDYDALSVWMYDEVEANGKYTLLQTFGQLSAMLSLLGGFIYLSYLYDAPSRDPAAPRHFPFDNLYLERGGDPNKAPSEKDLKAKVQMSYGETSC